MDDALIRDSRVEDFDGIESLYRLAFPEEDLLPLIRALLADRKDVLSLVVERGGAVAGHVVFTSCSLAGHDAELALLGPLAVMPDQQRKGIGSRLIRAGIDRLRARGAAGVCVLGDPAYYGRSGFAATETLQPPYPLPDAYQGAWQFLPLVESARSIAGTLAVPGPWQEPALWAD